jgi:CBS domain-containing protein
MFTVYGLQGRLYSGPLEQVRDLAEVKAVARTRAVAPVARQDQASPGAVIAALSGEAGGNAGAAIGGGSPRQALAAYAQTQQQGTGAAQRHVLMHVGELMSRKLVTVPVGATLREAWGVLAQAGIGQAPVLGEQGQLVGLIGRSALMRDEDLPADMPSAFAWSARLAHPVAELMWSPVPAAHADSSPREAAQLMLELQLPGLPVLSDDDERLIGFLSRTDLLRALTREGPLDLWS